MYEITSFFASVALKPFCPKMSSPSLEERASDWGERGQRGAQSRTCRSPPALAPVLCYATDRVPGRGHGEQPEREMAPSHRTSWPCKIKRSTVALQRAQPRRFWREPRQEGGEGRRRKLRAPARVQTPPGLGSGQSRSEGLAAAAPRSSGRAAPQRSPPAPAPGSSRSPFSDRLSASSSLPPSCSPAAAAGGGPEPPGAAGSRRFSSLSRRQLPLSLHPHIPPPAAAAAAPKFTALRRHEVILPAPSAGRRTPLPPRRGRRPRRPAARAPRGPSAPPAPEEPPVPQEHPCPIAREACEGRHRLPGAVAVRGTLPRHGGGMGRSAPRQPCLPGLRGRGQQRAAGGVRAPLRARCPAPPAERGRAAPAALQGRSQGRAAPGRAACLGLAV